MFLGRSSLLLTTKGWERPHLSKSQDLTQLHLRSMHCPRYGQSGIDRTLGLEVNVL
jgi:hypothetical protein